MKIVTSKPEVLRFTIDKPGIPRFTTKIISGPVMKVENEDDNLNC